MNNDEQNIGGHLSHFLPTSRRIVQFANGKVFSLCLLLCFMSFCNYISQVCNCFLLIYLSKLKCFIQSNAWEYEPLSDKIASVTLWFLVTYESLDPFRGKDQCTRHSTKVACFVVFVLIYLLLKC